MAFQENLKILGKTCCHLSTFLFGLFSSARPTEDNGEEEEDEAEQEAPHQPGYGAGRQVVAVHLRGHWVHGEEPVAGQCTHYSPLIG